MHLLTMGSIQIQEINFVLESSRKLQYLQDLRSSLREVISQINRQQGISENFPFKMNFEEAGKYRLLFYKNSQWISFCNELLSNFGLKNQEIHIAYPWWNDVTAVFKSYSNGEIIASPSHSYLTQINKLNRIGISPLSIVCLTCLEGDKYLLAEKSGAYNGKMMFIPSGSVTLNNSSGHLSLEDLVNYQFEEEVGISKISDVKYVEIINDKVFGMNKLIITMANLLEDSSQIKSKAMEAGGGIEFSAVHTLSKKELLNIKEKLLFPSRKCLPFL